MGWFHSKTGALIRIWHLNLNNTLNNECLSFTAKQDPAGGNSPSATQPEQYMPFIKRIALQNWKCMDSTLPCWHQENVRRLAFNTIHSGTASHCSQNLSDYVEKKALRTLIRQQARSLRVMAGFRWAPLMWPIHCPNMAIARPKANVTFFSRSGVRMISVPQLKPDNKDGHSQGLGQNHPLVLIFDMAMCFMSVDANIPCGTGQQSNWKHNEWHSVSFIRCVALKKKKEKKSQG